MNDQNIMKGKPCKQQLKKVCKLDTCKAFNKSEYDQEESFYLDNRSDTFGVGGDAWITESITDQNVDIAGYDEEDTTQTDVPIRSVVIAVDLTDSETIIVRSNKATFLGESENSLFSEAQMVENGVHVQQINDERKYLDLDVYIIPFTLKEDMMNINI